MEGISSEKSYEGKANMIKKTLQKILKELNFKKKKSLVVNDALECKKFQVK